MSDNTPSYLQTRIYETMGITPEQNKVKVITLDQYDSERTIEMPIFSSDKDDNIDILVYTIDRKLIRYDHISADPLHANINNNREQHFKITRLKEPKDPDMKYRIPKGVGTFPFIPPALLDKYEAGEEIKTLVMTEGYFKAFKAAVHGWDIVGLSSIHHYADKKTKQIHPDIAKIILKCKVKNVVMLYDGDCLNISTKDLQAGNDIARRPNLFLSSMLKIREILTDFDVTIYFSHIKSDDIQNKPKGLDDLLIELKGKEDIVLTDLMQLGIPGNLFYRLNVSSYLKKLQGYFNLKSAENFYEAWADYIKDREFNYFGTRYKYSESEKKLIKTVPKEAKNFMRVGDDYYELVELPTIYEDTETKLYKRAKSTIKDDFGKEIFDSIPKYKAFTNMPSHTNFQQVIDNCYNKYAPFTHEAKEGDWSTTEFFLKHIFGEHYEYGLDYIQILYQYPTQILPILCLVSKENKTGKTTFLDFLKLIFGENACKVGNAELSNEFNSFTATRLVVGVDETFLEKKTTIEKIKMLSTSNRIAMQRKGVDHEEMWHFAKYILVSNNEDNFIYASDEDVRYWVRKVPRIQKEIPDMLTILHEEVPAFLFMLNNRKISVPKTGRAWFDPALLETEALKRLRLASKSTAEKEITSFIHNMFMEFGVAEIKMTIDMLKERTVKNKYEDSYITRILTDNMKVEKADKVMRYKIPRWTTDPMDDTKIIRHDDPQAPGRPYIFKIENFLTPDEMTKIGFTISVEPEGIPAKEQTEQTDLPF
ncbi:MAG: DUF5906 domain-containing protein [Paludibacter sp.]